MKTVLGIFRAACYSPGMVERDKAILEAVMARLQAENYQVRSLHEEELTPTTPMPNIAIHMTRSEEALAILQYWQRSGCTVINTVEGIRSVERGTLAKSCATQGTPTPRTWIASTAGDMPPVAVTTEKTAEEISFPCWIKRTGDCAQQRDDVSMVSSMEEYAQCLSRFHARGIPEVVVMEHLEGSCIKFYGVQGTNFFHWLPAHNLGYDKWTTTTHARASEAVPTATDEATLHIGDVLRRLTDLDCIRSRQLAVYGGDAIIGPDGTARLIDLNDWPSFSSCRHEAAEAIAQLVMSMA